MKLEPLKDKRLIIGIEDFPKKYPQLYHFDVYRHTALKSAVEWLKAKMYAWNNVKDLDTKQYEKVINLIDKAFEDVMKK